jgi:hypothetical protein
MGSPVNTLATRRRLQAIRGVGPTTHVGTAAWMAWRTKALDTEAAASDLDSTLSDSLRTLLKTNWRRRLSRRTRAFGLPTRASYGASTASASRTANRQHASSCRRHGSRRSSPRNSPITLTRVPRTGRPTGGHERQRVARGCGTRSQTICSREVRRFQVTSCYLTGH